MNGDTLRFIRSAGKGLLTEVNKELFLNFSGLKVESRIAEAYGSKREFLEPEFFLSCKEEAGGGGEEKTRLRLISSFLARALIGGRSAGLTDRALAHEAGAGFRAGGKKLTLRSAEAALLSEPKKHRREEIAAAGTKVFSVLDALCLRKLDVMTECSESLGFRSYGELIDKTSDGGIAVLKNEAAKFLADTDYISRDMLGWFFMKKMELPLKDASIRDMTYLFNSSELRSSFAKIEPALLTGKVLEGMALSPYRIPECDAGKRAGKEVRGISLPLNPPSETSFSIYPAGGIHDYESLLGCLGHALSYGFTDPDDDFELVFLRDPWLPGLFSELFSGLASEPTWLKRYPKIDAGGDFFKFLQARRIMAARIEAGRAIYAHELFTSVDRSGLPETFADIMSGAAKCRADRRDYVADFISPVLPPFRFKAVLAAPGFRRHMRERFDEEWWRTSAAGEYLSGLWSAGGRLTLSSLLGAYGSGAPDSETAVMDLEETLR